MAVKIFCMVVAPIVALFVSKEVFTGHVATLPDPVITFKRDNLIKPL